MRASAFVNKYLPYLLFFAFGLVFLAKPIMDLDEIWNYGFASYVANGMQPYRDFSMIQTPLAAYLAAPVLRIFGDSLLVFRILGAVLFSGVFGLLYTMCGSLIKNFPVAFALSSFSGALCSLIWMYNYNHLMLLCIIVIILMEYRLHTECTMPVWLLHLVIGLLFGMTPVIKQSTGAFLFLFNIMWCSYRLATGAAEGKMWVLRIGAAIVPPTLFLLGTVIQGAFWDFFDYAVAGVKTFTHCEKWTDFIMNSPTDFIVGIFPLCVTLLSAYMVLSGKMHRHRIFLLETIGICWAGAAVAYPICDFVHASVAAIPFLIPLTCCIREIHMSKKDGVLCCLMAILVLSCSAFLVFKELPKYKKCELPHFVGLPISQEIETQISVVDEYLLEAERDGIEVLIADEEAAAYMIPVEKYYKDFNLLLLGNVGSKTVEELLWRENAIYLVAGTDEFFGKQAHRAVIEYIKENYTKVGEVLGFEAYRPR